VVPIVANPTAEVPLAERLINAPSQLKPWGHGAEFIRDKKVQGGKAIRITTSGEEANPWDVGVYSDVTGPVQQGDKIILAFWARLEQGGEGEEFAILPHNAIQFARPPHMPVFSGAVTITPEWELHQIGWVAEHSYEAGELTAALQLADSKRIVDIGPLFVFNMGP